MSKYASLLLLAALVPAVVGSCEGSKIETPDAGGGGGKMAAGGAGGSTTGNGGSSGGGPGGGAGAGGVATGTGGSATGAGGAGARGAGGATATGGTTGAGGTTGPGGITGAGGGTLPSFFFGADITDQETAPAAAIPSLLSLMKSYGFNFVRLRTFVDPRAADGYDKNNGFDDIAHTVVFGKMIKDAGMGLLIDFHMSDNWADPGKQCVPVAWQVYANITDLSTALHDYVKDAITKLVAGGARPDMVQIGNETTPGMLLHVCDAGGQPTGNNRVQGAATTAGWPNLGMLLQAGVNGVKEVDPGILISFHIDRGNSFSASKFWLDNLIRLKIPFDAFGESCYQQYQGDINSIPNTVNGWTTTFAQLIAAYPNVRFFAAEYGPLQRQINDVLFNLPNNQGMGTFDWEPTSRGTWNAAQPTDPAGTTTHALFQRSGNTYTALPDLALYTLMKAAYAARL
jgi:arabinogalactan endo-1,4-beta-galactosidase